MPVLVAKMTIFSIPSFATDTGRKTPVLAEKKRQYCQKMPEMCSCDGGLKYEVVETQGGREYMSLADLFTGITDCKFLSR